METFERFDSCVKLSPNESKLPEHMYNTLLSISSSFSEMCKSKWENEFGKPIPDGLWEECLRTCYFFPFFYCSYGISIIVFKYFLTVSAYVIEILLLCLLHFIS